MTSIAFYGAILKNAIDFLNQFCFQYERLINTTNNGFGEILALQMGENIRESVL